MSEEKGFFRLAFERLITNLLSVKVWLFLIPVGIATFFLWWGIDTNIDTTLYVVKSMSDTSGIVEVASTGLNNIKDMFSAWLKFTGSLVGVIAGVREIWKVSKIREETRRQRLNGKE